MPYYPVFLDLNGQKVLVVGGGEVAERKVKSFLLYGCEISIISPHLTAYLKELVVKKRIHHIPHESLNTFLDDAFMVIAATDDSTLNSQIASQSKERGILVNVVDEPSNCNFIMPSVIKRGDLQIAISTAGKSPALAKKIRKEMDSMFGQEYASFVELLGLLRSQLLSKQRPSSQNKTMFQQLVDSNLLELIREENWDSVKSTLISLLGDDFPVEHIVNQVFLGR
jgi:precorrin-2 dehydrogenase/sirohydrochlorin ferrochelatase